MWSDEGVARLRDQLEGAGCKRSLETVRDALADIEEAHLLPREGTNVNAVVELVRLRLGCGTSISVEPPPDWLMHSRRVLQYYRPMQAPLLSALGLPGFVTWAQIQTVVERVLFVERRKGELVWLEYPYAEDVGEGKVERRTGRIEVWQGLTDEESAAVMRQAGIDGSWPTICPPENPLYRLARAADEIVRSTGVTRSKAVAFLLADEDVSLPWIEGSQTWHQLTGTVEVTLQIGTTEVRPEEVAAAYERLRSLPPWAQELTGTLENLSGPGPAGAYRRARRHNKTAEMVRVVSAYKREHHLDRLSDADWEACNRLLEEAIGEGYSSIQVMRSRYSTATRAKRHKGSQEQGA